MSMQLDATVANVGTRFRIFPQPRFLNIFAEPELITVSVPPDQIQDGPADGRMFVVDALNKLPYSQFFRPPYIGPRNPAVRRGPGGHFDHLDPNSREFSCATMYATVRRVLDIWEDYFRHRIEWQFESDFARLEMIPLIEWNNAQSGYGFLEFGYGRNVNGAIDHTRPYCENFDVLAHELGHSIIFSEVGVPSSVADEAIDYGGMHESAGDLVAIVATLHFHSVVDYLLGATHGNLFTVNELDRVGELSQSREIRRAFNSLRMSDVGDEPHARSQPLTGGIFDIMVEVFQKQLVAQGLITQALADRSTQGPGPGRDQDLQAVQEAFDAAYAGNEAGFNEALLQARDYLGRLLALTWGGMNPNFLTYHDILRRLLRADRLLAEEAGLAEPENQETIRSCFAWREITPVPGSLLLRPHSVMSCGLATAGRATPEAVGAPDAQALEAVVRQVLEQLNTQSGKDSKAQKLAPRRRRQSSKG
jgi:hypothetical protein